MQVKINIYTSYYKKMLKRHKQENDFYVQISRSLYMPVKNSDGIKMNDLIDLNIGDVFGNVFQSLAEYEEYWSDPQVKDVLDNFAQTFSIENLGLTEKDLEENYKKLSATEKKEVNKIGYNENECNFNFYLLCYENLEETYTEKEAEKLEGLVKAGENKRCHRTILAKILNDLYKLNITEYKGE